VGGEEVLGFSVEREDSYDRRTTRLSTLDVLQNFERLLPFRISESRRTLGSSHDPQHSIFDIYEMR